MSSEQTTWQLEVAQFLGTQPIYSMPLPWTNLSAPSTGQDAFIFQITKSSYRCGIDQTVNFHFYEPVISHIFEEDRSIQHPDHKWPRLY